MQAQLCKSIWITIFSLVVAGCATSGGPSDEETLTAAGAVRLNGEQVKAHVTGKTEAWLHGGAYYMADGRLKVKWRKTYSSGSWEVSADGTLCYQLPKWERRCQFYMNMDGAILLLESGDNIGERKMYVGDNLAALGTYAAGSGRTR